MDKGKAHVVDNSNTQRGRSLDIPPPPPPPQQQQKRQQQDTGFADPSLRQTPLVDTGGTGFADSSLRRTTPEQQFKQVKQEQFKRGRQVQTNTFTDGRLPQNRLGPKRPSAFSLGPRAIDLSPPTQSRPRPGGSYAERYATTLAIQNELKEKYERARLRSKKKGLTRISRGTSLMDSYRTLGRK